MATIKPTVVGVGRNDGSTLLVTWGTTLAPITEADTCAAQSFPENSDKTFQVSAQAGGWGGATAVLKGSNDGVTYIGLRDPGGTAISMTADGLKAVLENTVFFQPSISGGTSQSLIVSMLVHLTNPLRT